MGITESLKKRVPAKHILQIVCVVGLVLSVCISIPLLIVSIIQAKEDFQQKLSYTNPQNPFIENLNQFDTIFAENELSLPVSHLDFILNTAETNAVGVENHLSVLKRRRILAKKISEYQLQYQNAALRSLELFPYSEIISILAGEALLLQKNNLDENDKNSLSNYIKNISARNSLVLLGFHLFDGSARNLISAKQISQSAELFSSVIDYTSNIEQTNLITSAVILQILNGNQQGAINLINKYRTVLLLHPTSAWFAVETLYDFDDPKTAVSILGTEDYPFVNSQSIIRLSDALYRINNISDARFFWNLLTVSENAPEGAQESGQDSVPQVILGKALYNLAGTSQSNDEKQLYLQELLKIAPDFIPGIIMYSRLLNYQDAELLLHQTLAKNKEPLIELELIRRNRGYAEPGKTAADTWLLLGHYPENSELYEWASYYFEDMRMFDELDQLEKNVAYNNIDDHWVSLQKALNAIRKGELNQAETLLKNIPSPSSWEISANLGLIKESQLSYTEAIDYFETASSLCKNNKDLALIQLNISRCFKALGNPEEALRVLHYAEDLDPDNLRIRLEIRKLDYQ